MAELQVVVLAVAGSSPVDHPTPPLTARAIRKIFTLGKAAPSSPTSNSKGKKSFFNFEPRAIYCSSFCFKSAGMTVEERTNERAAFGSIFFQSLTIRFSELLSRAGSEMREAH